MSTTLTQVMEVTSRINAQPYNWPHDAPIQPNNTALVIIDMQNDFASSEGYLPFQGLSIDPVRAVIPPIKLLLDTFRERGFKVYHTREGHRPDLSTLSSRELYRSRNNPSGIGIGDPGPMGRLLIRGERGHDTIPELYPIEGENVIDKPGRSAFQHTDFKLLLDVAGIKNLVICGVTTDVCVTTTMRQGNDLGLDCVLVQDACAAGVERLHQAAIDMIGEEGGIFGAVTTTKEILRVFGKEMSKSVQPPSINGNGISLGLNGHVNGSAVNGHVSDEAPSVKDVGALENTDEAPSAKDIRVLEKTDEAPNAEDVAILEKTDEASIVKDSIVLEKTDEVPGVTEVAVLEEKDG